MYVDAYTLRFVYLDPLSRPDQSILSIVSDRHFDHEGSRPLVYSRSHFRQNDEIDPAHLSYRVDTSDLGGTDLRFI